MRFELTRHAKDRLVQHWPKDKDRIAVLDAFGEVFKLVKKGKCRSFKRDGEAHEKIHVYVKDIGDVTYVFHRSDKTIITLFPTTTVGIRTQSGLRSGYLLGKVLET